MIFGCPMEKTDTTVVPSIYTFSMLTGVEIRLSRTPITPVWRCLRRKVISEDMWLSAKNVREVLERQGEILAMMIPKREIGIVIGSIA
jgi:hypothetical protein